MRAAVVSLTDYIVVNIIVADASKDPAPDGCILVDVTDIQCDIGWIYDPDTGTFTNPNPPPPVPDQIIPAQG